MNNQNKGNVYIASMNMRGKWADKPNNCEILNVTSMQRKDSLDRNTFSPMNNKKYKNFYCFENYWQSGKVIEGVDYEKHYEWWINQQSPKRRYPNSKGKKILYSLFNGIQRDYITSRKEIYVPEYAELIKNSERLQFWKNKINSGKNIVVYDFDGPRKEDGSVDCQLVSKDFLINKINDVKFPFGHGYVVSMLLSEIDYKELIKK